MADYNHNTFQGETTFGGTGWLDGQRKTQTPDCDLVVFALLLCPRIQQKLLKIMPAEEVPHR